MLSVFERASVAWHGLFCLQSEGSKVKIEAGHRREASQQMVPSQARRIKTDNVESKMISPAGRVKSEGIESKAMKGLQAIYGPDAKPKSEGQASALELVHQVHRFTDTLIVVLPTSSGKSVLFFSVAATAVQQTVIVVVPFAALVDDIIQRGEEAGLNCEEWRDESSGGESRQLVVVSADRAVSGEFLHYAVGLQQNQELACVFFDECHVAFTDTSYRARLRELWLLRYLDCPFICLTATLMVQLEDLLRDQLLIPNAQLFRRVTSRRSIRYRVHDSKDEPASNVGVQLIQGLGLPIGKRGVIYVRSYNTGNKISEALQCPFYKARADHKSQILQDWIEGPGGWIVATGALGTGINIEGIIYVVHIDRPYGLTSFVQQSGRGGRAGEISDSIIIVRVKNTSGRRRSEILSEYSVEQIDENAMTEFIQSTQCRRVVLGRYLDVGEAVDCQSIDGVFCDQCKAQGRAQASKTVQVSKESIDKAKGLNIKQEPESGSQAIARRLEELVEADEMVFQVMDRLKRQCLFCELIHGDSNQVHKYEECPVAVSKQCGYIGFQEWRKTVQFGGSKHCWKCGLSQEMCRGLERGIGCEYPDIMMPGIYLLHQGKHLQGVAETAGFHGDYEQDFWEWMQEEGEGFGRVRESHWIGVWRQICYMYLIIKGEKQI